MKTLVVLAAVVVTSLAQVSAPVEEDVCYTVGRQECVFPFRYKGKRYTECTYAETSNNKPWCAYVANVELTRSGRPRSGQLGDCDLTSFDSTCFVETPPPPGYCSPSETVPYVPGCTRAGIVAGGRCECLDVPSGSCFIGPRGRAPGCTNAGLGDRGVCYCYDGPCYANPGLARVLDLKFNDENMTPTLCQDYCRNQNYYYAGVEFGTQCFCGNTHPEALLIPSRAVDDGECSISCGGDSSQKCGGFFRINIYPVDLP